MNVNANVPMQVKWSCVSFILSHPPHVISYHLMSCHHLILIDHLRFLLLIFRLVVSSFFNLLSSISPLFSCLFCLLFSPFYLAFHLFSILLFCLVLVLVLVLVRCVASLVSFLSFVFHLCLPGSIPLPPSLLSISQTKQREINAQDRGSK